MKFCSVAIAALVLALTATTASAADASYKIAELKEAPPELSAEVTATLNKTGYRVEGSAGVICDLWLAKEVPLKPNFTPGLQVKYPFLPGQLIGAIRFPAKTEEGDFRGQMIPPGMYTLRYGLQPNDGNHLGTSDVRDFALACPPKTDTDPARVEKIKDLFKLSAKAAGTTHPAVFLLTPAPEEPQPAPAVQFDEEKKQVIVTLKANGKDEDQVRVVPFSLVVVGKSAG